MIFDWTSTIITFINILIAIVLVAVLVIIGVAKEKVIRFKHDL